MGEGRTAWRAQASPHGFSCGSRGLAQSRASCSAEGRRAPEQPGGEYVYTGSKRPLVLPPQLKARHTHGGRDVTAYGLTPSS
jgi:hypothetical protein